MEVEAPADGVLAGITGSVGADIPVGQTIAWIVSPGEKAACRKQIRRNRARSARENGISRRPQSRAAAAESQAVQSARISPKARRLAKELGVDIASFGAARARAAKFLRRTCKPQPRPWFPVHPTRNQPASKAPSTLGPPDGPNARRRVGQPFLTFLSRVKSMRSRAQPNIGKNVAAEIERTHRSE